MDFINIYTVLSTSEVIRRTSFPIAAPIWNHELLPIHVFGPNILNVQLSFTDLRLHQEAIIRYLVCNLSHVTQRIQITIDSNEACVLSGYKKASFLLLPHSYLLCYYHIVPLRIGWIILPRWRLAMEESQLSPSWKELSSILQISFVLPQKTE
jgi:hypothetical protein